MESQIWSTISIRGMKTYLWKLCFDMRSKNFISKLSDQRSRNGTGRIKMVYCAKDN